MSVAIEAQSVSKIFNAGSEHSVTALDDVTVEISDNEFFTLLGPSGCGKTTLLRLIAGFEHPSSGLIKLHGENISSLPPFRRPVNTVFQNYALFPHMTVSENIAFGLEMQGQSKDNVAQTTQEMLQLVRMQELSDRRTSQISGGQQQRVALARALAPHPKVLLLDEPLSALDFKLRKDMQLELKRLQHETGITFIFVTHDQEEALTMSDRIAVMNAGRILQIGSPKDIYEHPAERFVADFIGDTNFIVADVVSDDGKQARLKFMSGSEIEVALPEELSGADHVTVAIRPEQVMIGVDSGSALFQGNLEQKVYFGTDTHYHIRLPDGELFIARIQNARGQTEQLECGANVGIGIEPDAIQILRD